MRRLLASEMSYISRFLATRIIPIWHQPYDAVNHDLERLTGMTFNELEEIMKVACTQACISEKNANYYAFYERENDTIEIVFPILNHLGGTYIHTLFKKIEENWHKQARSNSKISFVRQDMKNVRDFDCVMKYDCFLISFWKYMIVIS